jgi:hypothetical protein
LKDEIPLIIEQSKQLGEYAQQMERTVRDKQERAAEIWRILLRKKEEVSDMRMHLLDLKEKNAQLIRYLEEWRVYKTKLETQ